MRAHSHEARNAGFWDPKHINKSFIVVKQHETTQLVVQLLPQFIFFNQPVENSQTIRWKSKYLHLPSLPQ